MLHEMGRQRRLGRLVPAGRAAVWLPLDDGLISGPEDHLRDPRALLAPDVVGHITAVLGFRGTLTACRRQLDGLPVMMNLTAGTTLHDHTRKVAVGEVLDAVRAGVEGIVCHVNLTSPYEQEQLDILSRRISEAESYGLPVVAMAYPRTRRVDGSDENYLDLRQHEPDEFAVLVRHCVRIAVDLGASAVKTIFTGTVESFRTVVDSAMEVPVLIAGERLVDEAEAIEKAQLAVRAGAAGVAFGRQIFARPDPAPFVQKLRSALDDQWMESRRGLQAVPFDEVSSAPPRPDAAPSLPPEAPRPEWAASAR